MIRAASAAAPLLAAALALLAPGEAFAQFAGSGASGLGGATRMRPPEQGRDRPRPPPPGLPGLAGRPAAGPIPAETDPAGLPPNEALFDGISRGDINTVRDAIGRGADVNARNALGLSALDAAVDQGRPEITFYLLSVRGVASNPPEPEGGRGTAASQGRRGAAPARAEREPRPARGAPAEPAAAAATPAAARLPTLWAGGGGAPQPEIGFLGFDAGRPAGAERPAAGSGRTPSARRG